MNKPGARIDLEGALNLRDLGGWAADGGTVAYGRIFRSDRLSELSDADLATFAGLGVRTVIDLRHGSEVEEAPSRLWPTVDYHENIPMAGDSVQPRTFLEMAFSGEMDGMTDAFVGETYISMLTRHAQDFGRAINLAVSRAPSLFHCTAGKDRTGLFAMLVLRSIGVSHDDVMTDFTLSNPYRAEARIVALAPMFAEPRARHRGLPARPVRAGPGARHGDRMARRHLRWARRLPGARRRPDRTRPCGDPVAAGGLRIAVRIPDETLAEVRSRGFAIVPGFLSQAELEAAQRGLPLEYPAPDEYYANPAAYEHLVSHPFAGLKVPPFQSFDLARLAFHPDLVDAAERYCGTTDLQLYKIELWAKYGGSVDYDQPHHRDYGNHSLVVPRADGRWPQLTTFILLSDVDDDSGPTKVLPRSVGDELPMEPRRQPMGDLFDRELSVCGPAGTLFLYTTDVLHRGSAIRGPRSTRFALLADYSARGNPWMGKISWPDRANKPGWSEMMAQMSVRQRDLFGFPPPGHEYWNEQTLRDVALRYPDMDMSPYRSATLAT